MSSNNAYLTSAMLLFFYLYLCWKSGQIPFAVSNVFHRRSDDDNWLSFRIQYSTLQLISKTTAGRDTQQKVKNIDLTWTTRSNLGWKEHIKGTSFNHLKRVFKHPITMSPCQHLSYPETPQQFKKRVNFTSQAIWHILW